MIADILVWFLVFVFSTTCHEFAHAFVAFKGGDSTAYEGGQVSLDPRPHIKRSPIGMVVVPLASMFLSNMTSMIGWGAAPYNPFWASRHPKRYALMSLAGPCANVVLASIAFVSLIALSKADLLMLSEAPSFDTLVTPPGEALNTPLGALARVLSVMFSLNVLLAIFNLLPVPPLDGAAVIEGFWPERVGGFMAKVRETPMYGLLGLVVVWQLVPHIVTPVWVALVITMHQL